jgi:hypothetical protein
LPPFIQILNTININQKNEFYFCGIDILLYQNMSFNYIVRDLCEKGDIEQVKKLLTDPSNQEQIKSFPFGAALCDVCVTGDLNMTKLLFVLGHAVLTTEDLHVCLLAICRGGTDKHLCLLKCVYDITNGFGNCGTCDYIDAIFSGHAPARDKINMCRFIWDHTHNSDYNINEACMYAAQYNDLESILILLDEYPVTEERYKYCALGAYSVSKGFGHQRIIDYLNVKNYEIPYGQCIDSACGQHNTSLVKFLVDKALEKKQKLVLSLWQACYNNDRQLVDFFLEIGQQHHISLNFAGGFHGACQHGLTDLAKLMLEQSLARDNHPAINYDWDFGVVCPHHIDIMKMIIDAANQQNVTLTKIMFNLVTAYQNHNLEAIQMIEEYMTQHSLPIDWSQILYGTCQTGQQDSVDHLLKKDDPKLNLDQGLLGACAGGQVDMIRQLLDRMDAEHINHLKSDIITELCTNGYLELVNQCFKQYITIQDLIGVIEKILYQMDTNSWQGQEYRIELVQFLKAHQIEIDYNRCLKNTCRYEFADRILLYLLKSGATNIAECLAMKDISNNSRILLESSMTCQKC